MKKCAYLLFIVMIASIFTSCEIPTQSALPTLTTTPNTTQQTTKTSTPTAAIPTDTVTMKPVSVKLKLTEAYPALSFEKPLYFAIAGDGSKDCYVVEQTGKIRVFTDSPGATNALTFLDISNKVNLGGNEKGLLGLAFHPNYTENGYLYVNYTDRNNSVIARYTRRTDNPKEADPASEQIILTFRQPYANHNGGQLAFGPDGYLYIATGDGGSAGDPHNYAQNRSSLLGKILRIDVDHTDRGGAYGIPADNPYAGNKQGYREEIYALGLRNPWRFSFDARGTLWVADVGQNTREEVDLIKKGGNYGWNVMEGTLDFKNLPSVNKTELLPPIWEYGHDQGECITGGYCYSSSLIEDLKGRYIYGDYVSGKICTLWFDENQQVHNQELLDTKLNISSFGVDVNGDLRIVDLAGKLYRLQISGT